MYFHFTLYNNIHRLIQLILFHNYFVNRLAYFFEFDCKIINFFLSNNFFIYNIFEKYIDDCIYLITIMLKYLLKTTRRYLSNNCLMSSNNYRFSITKKYIFKISIVTIYFFTLNNYTFNETVNLFK